MTRNFNCAIKSLGCRNLIPSIALVLLNIIRTLETKMGIFGAPEAVLAFPGRFDMSGGMGRSGPILTMWTNWEVM